jgi:glycine/D-amino acid oxidase-like deaminating enzyme
LIGSSLISPPTVSMKCSVHAMGYSGHGAQMSVHMGQQMAAVMAGDAAANPLRNLTWPAIFGHFGPPWFMPFVGAYYSFKDKTS